MKYTHDHIYIYIYSQYIIYIIIKKQTIYEQFMTLGPSILQSWP